MIFDRHSLKDAARRIIPKADPDDVTREIIENGLALPVCEITEEETGAEAVFDMGRALARQADWDELAKLITIHDRARDMTRAGTPLAELLCTGARADIMRAMKSAARSSKLKPNTPAILAMQDICEDLTDPELGHGGAVMAAELMMEAGWAWYQQGAFVGKPERHLDQFESLFAQARARVAPYSALEENAPALAAVNCALLAGDPEAKARVQDDYEDLIDLNPRAPGHIRAYGIHLLPQWFGGFDILELQACRIAAQTNDVWGAGGYTWMWLDALAQAPESFAYVDMTHFLDGIDDILARRPHQHFVNLFAAFLSRYLDGDEGGPDDEQRRQIIRRRSGLLRGRLEELHLWVWASGPASDAMPRKGSDAGQALIDSEGGRLLRNALTTVFAREITRATTPNS